MTLKSDTLYAVLLSVNFLDLNAVNHKIGANKGINSDTKYQTKYW